MALDASLGGAASNSYATVAEADDYAAMAQWGSAWLALTQTDKEIALVSATKWLETLDYGGTRCDPSTDAPPAPQALKWPRSGITCDGITSTCVAIPVAVKNTQIELAYQLNQNPNAVIPAPGGGAAAGTYVSKEKLGDLEINYDAYPSGVTVDDCTSCSDPQVIAAFPWIKDMLGCWYGGAASARQIRLYRN
jgi:hypothetical protein